MNPRLARRALVVAPKIETGEMLPVFGKVACLVLSPAGVGTAGLSFETGLLSGFTS